MKFSRPIRLKEIHFKTATTAATKSTEHILLQQRFTQLLVPINSTEKRRLKGNLTAVHNYLLEWYGKDRARLLEFSSEGWETTGKSCSKGNSNKILGKKESPWRRLSPRGGCSERLWNLHHWRDPKFDWSRSCATSSDSICFDRRAGSENLQRPLTTHMILWFCSNTYQSYSTEEFQIPY